MRAAFLYNRFPLPSETFLRRELEALGEAGLEVEVFSIWGGGGTALGRPVQCWSGWAWWSLLWRVPAFILRRPALAREVLGQLFRRRPPSWEALWENLAGLGFAVAWHARIAKGRYDWIQAAWAGGPASAAWLLGRATGIPWGTGAHAYDVFQHGGDWLARPKLREARLVVSSTEEARRQAVSLGAQAGRTVRVRRGLLVWPPERPLRGDRRPLRLFTASRFVPKKGLAELASILGALRRRGLAFEARIAGDGPLRRVFAEALRREGVAESSQLLGFCTEEAVLSHMSWADAYLHTGVTAPDGNRDGLPNAVAEAMASGAVVLASDQPGVREAIADGVQGILLNPREPALWADALARVRDDDDFCLDLRAAARRWVEAHFDARRNARQILEAIEQARSVPFGSPLPLAMDQVLRRPRSL